MVRVQRQIEICCSVLWLGLSPVLISLLTAVAANALQLAMLAVVIWYPAVQRGCFGAMAGLGEALMVLPDQN